MAEQHTKMLRRIFLVITAIALLMVAFSYIRAKVLLHETRAYSENARPMAVGNGELTDINDDWLLILDGEATEQITLPYTVSGEYTSVSIQKQRSEIPGSILKFDNNRQGALFFEDERILYQVNTTPLRRQVHYTDYQIICLSEDSSLISITFTDPYQGNYELPEMKTGSLYAARYEILKDESLSIVILGLLLVLGIIMMLLYVYTIVQKTAENRMLCLTVFLLIAVIWGFTDSYLAVLTPFRQEILGMLNYYALMSLPIPMCCFVWITCERTGYTLPILAIIGVANICVEALLSLLGLLQLQKTMYLSYVFIIVIIVAAIWKLMHWWKGKTDIALLLVVIGCNELAVMATMAILLYILRGTAYYRNCLLLGVLLFLVILYTSIIYQRQKRYEAEQLRLSEIKIHERLAFFDQLTGLENRRAFDMQLAELEKTPEVTKDAVLVMMDLNGLKLTNDTYGHSAGDDLICEAANTIKKVYGDEGYCYRIGGDEFVVLMLHPSVSIKTLDERLREEMEKFNVSSIWKLSIARGASYRTNSAGNMLSISDWKQAADVEMYRNKLATREGRSHSIADDLQTIIDCIIKTLEAKDVYSASHSDRVRELSRFIGEKLGLSPYTLDNLEVAAYLHDIGKIGVPDRVLLKPGALNNEEWALMKEHTTIGAWILGNTQQMMEISNIVLHHHERYEGKGYPDGIAGDAIPLESRIIAVADSIDAMTSKRVYRDSMSLDHCKAEIEKNIGRMYDPAIAQIVLENWTAIEDIVLLHPKRLLNSKESQ